MLTPFWGAMGNVSIAKAVVASAGPPGRALVLGDVALARALAQGGFAVVLATESKRTRPRAELQLIIARSDALPLEKAAFDAVVYSGRGAALLGAAEDAMAAGLQVADWARPLRSGGRLILVDRIDGGLLGARPAAAAEDLCAALLAGRLRAIAQASPKAGTVVTCGVRMEMDAAA